MFNSKKIGLILFLSIFLIIILGGFCFAQNKELEVKYPEVPGAITPSVVRETLLPEYIRYIFNFSIIIGGLVAFGVFILGGAKHLTSAGDPTKLSDARDQIFSGILGLVILLSSYLILTTINPQLVILKLPGTTKAEAPESPGVYICLDANLTKCTHFNADSASLPDDFDTKVQYIHFENPEGVKYGAVLHEDKGFAGNCVVCLSDGCGLSAIGGDGASSIHVFIQTESSSGEGISLYEKKEYNRECDSGECGRWPASGGYTKISLPDLNKTGKSIRIQDEGRYLAVLFEGTNFGGKCEVFRRSDPDLSSNYIGECGVWNNLGCLRSIIVSPIK